MYAACYTENTYIGNLLFIELIAKSDQFHDS